MYLCCAAVSEFVCPVGVYQNKNNVESEESSGDVFMVLSVVLYISLAVSAVFWLYNCFSYHPRTLGGPTAFPRLSSSYTCTICPLSSMFSGQGVHEKIAPAVRLRISSWPIPPACVTHSRVVCCGVQYLPRTFVPCRPFSSSQAPVGR